MGYVILIMIFVSGCYRHAWWTPVIVVAGGLILMGTNVYGVEIDTSARQRLIIAAAIMTFQIFSVFWLGRLARRLVSGRRPASPAADVRPPPVVRG